LDILEKKSPNDDNGLNSKSNELENNSYMVWFISILQQSIFFVDSISKSLVENTLWKARKVGKMFCCFIGKNYSTYDQNNFGGCSLLKLYQGLSSDLTPPLRSNFPKNKGGYS
jgi:hypothetical protein